MVCGHFSKVMDGRFKLLNLNIFIFGLYQVMSDIKHVAERLAIVGTQKHEFTHQWWSVKMGWKNSIWQEDYNYEYKKNTKEI